MKIEKDECRCKILILLYIYVVASPLQTYLMGVFFTQNTAPTSGLE